MWVEENETENIFFYIIGIDLVFGLVEICQQMSHTFVDGHSLKVAILFGINFKIISFIVICFGLT